MINTIKTILLLGVLSLLFIFIGRVIGGVEGMTMAFIFSLLLNGGAYFFSDKMALAASGAQPLSQAQAPQVYEMVTRLTAKMGLPMPKLYMIPSPQANAFATGRDPQHSAVAVTQGLLQVLSKDEVEGVIAHELAHIKNRDILIASIAAVVASTIGYLAQFAMFGGMRSSDEESSVSPWGAIAVMILAPIAATILQLAISRSREFAADETGARAMGKSEPLATALINIHNSARMNPMNINPAYSSMYIENPVGTIGNMAKLFSTHPPVEERISKLRSLQNL